MRTTFITPTAATFLPYLRERHQQPESRDHPYAQHLVLASALMTGAGLGWEATGDVWVRLAARRLPNLTSSFPHHVPDAEVAAVERLITAHETSWRTPVGKMTPERAAAFHVAGRRLADLAQHDHLTRGLNDVLADHVLAAWARAGIAEHQQAFCAAVAADIVLRRNRTPHRIPTSLPATGSCPSPGQSIAGRTLRHGTEQTELSRR
ncbi:thiopeptide-type bacteriocin biosynthesis protein [Nonomuraea jabiensis]|uniref:thiopeptide-type bacteriocin biosynthesis protein n=1 Tax=Nonomuraea jabiensis TaxID=882448 RepID=UPI0036B67B7A